MPAEAFQIIESIQGLPVLVIGDVMLDTYYQGTAGRISPEAPVPVVRIDGEHHVPGGAGNVAFNLARLGCSVSLAGLVGDDEPGGVLRTLLDEAGIDSSGLYAAPGPTTRKTRVLAATQHLVRMDVEERRGLAAGQMESFAASLSRLFAGVAVVVLSDYGKGLCDDALCPLVIEQCRGRGIPVLVDPKGEDWERYRGAAMVTPNLGELSLAAGDAVPNDDSAVAATGELVRERYDLSRLLVTRSGAGMSLIGPEGAQHRHTEAREISDVSGAGDTVAAVMAGALGAGRDLSVAMLAANRAAGIVVGKAGTYAVSAEELKRELRVHPEEGRLTEPFSAAVAADWDDALGQVQRWRRCGFRVAFTNGCFDLLHPGHIDCLAEARRMADRLVVAVNSDSSVRRLKGPDRPLQDQQSRVKVLSALAAVDMVVVFDGDTPAELVRRLRPDVLVKGGDYRPDEVAGAESADSVEIVPFVQDHSTTDLVERIRSRR